MEKTTREKYLAWILWIEVLNDMIASIPDRTVIDMARLSALTELALEAETAAASILADIAAELR